MDALSDERKIVALTGEWDIYLREHLRASLTFEDCQELVVDLSQANLIDATCIGEIVRAKRTANETGKRMRIFISPGRLIEKLFTSCDLHTTLSLEPCRRRDLGSSSQRVRRLGDRRMAPIVAVVHRKPSSHTHPRHIDCEALSRGKGLHLVHGA
jgi:anti-anti-sigma regulatory factor